MARGHVVNVEMSVSDTERARGFWSGLFGWEWQDMGGPSEYHMARISDESGLALSNAEPEKRGTRVYYDVEDIEAAIARVKELGGQSDDAMSVPSMGWFAACVDTEGNEFGLWQTDENAPMPEGMG